MAIILSQTFEKPERLILDWLKVNKVFFNSQRVLAGEIGYSRWTTNHALQELEKKGLITIKAPKNLQQKWRVIELTTLGAHGTN